MRKHLVTAAIALALSAPLFFWAQRSAPPSAVPAVAPAPAVAQSAPATAAPAPLAAAPGQAGDPALQGTDAEVIAALRERFGGHLAVKHAQIKLLEQVLAYLQQKYPDDWQTRVEGFLRALFPELAEELLRQLQALLGYNAWLEVHRDALLAMPAAERRRLLWEQRRAAFGADAEEIWAAEMRAERVTGVLAGLEDSGHLTYSEKLQSYLGAVTEAYGERAGTLIETRQTELMNRFLDVGAVQRDLAAMDAAARAAALRELRASMGMDEAALQRWNELDVQRDGAWTAGRGYMAERDRIVAQYQGAAREQQLRDLRARSFGAEAEAIRAEEEAGFYRYGHERRIGRE